MRINPIHLQIVLPNQANAMFEAVKSKGLPCAYVLFPGTFCYEVELFLPISHNYAPFSTNALLPGEQHGFRKAENVQKALDGEFLFFSKVFGFECADKDTEVGKNRFHLYCSWVLSY